MSRRKKKVTPKPPVSETLTSDDVQFLPPNIEPTREVIEELSRDFHIVRIESFNELVGEDDDAEDWRRIEKGNYTDRIKNVHQARHLVRKSPHCKRAIDLYLYYVLGSQFRPSLVPIIEDYDVLKESDEKKHKKVIRQAEQAWKTFRRVNRKAWTPGEKLSRLYRDGEVFTRVLERTSEKPGEEWVPLYRFVDPETIDDGEGDAGTKGIITVPGDVAEPLQYLIYDEEQGRVVDTVDADRMFHWKINVDSNEKRGTTQFESVITYIRQLMSLVHNEVTHRTAQSAIVLVRKVAGRNKPRQLSDNAYTSTTAYPEGPMGREKLRAGSILTTNPTTEFEFAQPNSNFSDATPLITLLVSHLSAATGWTISQLTTDPSGGNFASSLVNESPVLQMIAYIQGEFAEHMDDEFRYVVEAALEAGEIEYTGDVEDFWRAYETAYGFPEVKNIDPLKNEQRLNLGLMNGSTSQAQAQREKGLDPDKMRYERKKEMEDDLLNVADNVGKLPDAGNMQQTSKQNAGAGGTNQGDGGPIKHKDNAGVGGSQNA